ncbi:MAG: M14 metallopeptidase family protein [Fimbriimonadaceae bacterium]
MQSRKALALVLLLLPATGIAQIPTPESIIGHKVGADYKLAPWSKILRYFELLDKASARVSVRSIGKTSFGREMIVVEISSEANIRNLRRIYADQAMLHDPRKIQNAKDEADLLKRARTTILINCSIHGSEVGASQMSMELAYDLASGKDQKTKEILDNCVVQIVVGANPDGIELVREWYEKTLNTPYENAAMPWLYHKYVGHDNNRDWWMVSQTETQNVSRYIYNVGFPSVIYDVHQMGGTGARFFVPPFFDPVNPNIDPIISQSIFMIGGHMATDLASLGKQGVIWKAIYDNWWQGGMRTTPQRHNIVAILTEAASPRIASPVTMRPDQLRGHDRGLPTYERYVNFPDPWPGGTWRLRDVIDYEMIASKSLLTLGARYRDMWVRNHLAMSKKQLDLGKSEAPYAWVIPPQENMRGVAQLVKSLMLSGVEVHRIERKGVGGSIKYSGHDYVIHAAQPYRAHVKDLMEVQVYPDRRVFPGGPAERPYDVAGWTAPLMLGVQVREAMAPVTEQLTKIDMGDALFAELAKPIGVGKARAAIYQPFIGSMDEGWTRFIFEQHGVPYASLKNPEIVAGNLKAKYDAIFIPSISPATILTGTERTFPEYAGGIGPQGIEALKQFASEGGIISLFDDATGLAESLGLTVKNSLAGLGRDKFFCPGSILRTEVDAAHPLGYGMDAGPGAQNFINRSGPREPVLVPSIAYFADSKAFDIIPQAAYPATVVARYGAGNPLLSGYLLGPEHLAGKPAVVSFAYGKGQIVLFGFPPQYRGQSMATFGYLWNALRWSVAP